MSKKGAARDDAVKQYRYLSAMKKQGLAPQDWMIQNVPVIPPIFRPVSKMGDVALVSDLNELYKDVIENAKNFEDLRKDVDDEGLIDERMNIYNSVKAAYGLGQPINPENAAKGVKGAIRQVIGNKPKFGMFQSKVISKPVGDVSRGVVTPEPNYDMDQVGLPADMAWSMYKPYVMRQLVQHGYPTTAAIKMIADRTETAKSLLEKEMEKRPVIMDRAPTWHKFNLLAFTPHLIEGNTIRVSPLIVSGFNMDFDGDQVNLHVPASDKAVKQALEKMVPSANLTSLTDLKSPRHMPSKEQIFGLYDLTKPMEAKPVKVYNTVAEAKQAYAKGEIGPNDPIEILRR
jgi:DNA-directed RNA polymerase subunit beta'